MLKHYLPHITFFVAFFGAAIPVLYYIRRKNPDPRFRPNLGEMSLITLIAVCICGGMAFGLGSLFKPENDGTSLSKKPDAGAGWSAGSGEGGGSESGGRRPQKDRNSDSDDGEAPRRRLNDRN